MKKYTIYLVRAGMVAIVGMYLLLMGCNTQLAKNFGKAQPVNYPDVATDLVYGYKIIHVGESFPNISLNSPRQTQDRSYLGLDDSKGFTIRDVKADLVVVAMMNTHCQPCQKGVPIYNNLFKRLEADASPANRTKMLVVGVGNTEAEINAYRKKYGIPFPIVADSRLKLHDAVGQPKLPFTILVRMDKKSNEAVVALAYSKVSPDAESMYENISALTSLNVSAFRKQGLKINAKVYRVAQPFSQAEVESKIKNGMLKISPADTHLNEFEKIPLDGYNVYTAVCNNDKGSTRLFAEVVSRPSICNACDDVHFFYIFNEKGVLLDFVPLQVTKRENQEWSKKDVQLMRERLVGRLIYTPFYFNPELDAVTSATITSVVIFDELSRGDKLFELLKQKGFIAANMKSNL